MFPINASNDQIPTLILGLGWYLQQHEVAPETLRFNEIDAVFYTISLALCGIKFKGKYSI